MCQSSFGGMYRHLVSALASGAGGGCSVPFISAVRVPQDIDATLSLGVCLEATWTELWDIMFDLRACADGAVGCMTSGGAALNSPSPVVAGTPSLSFSVILCVLSAPHHIRIKNFRDLIQESRPDTAVLTCAHDCLVDLLAK